MKPDLLQDNRNYWGWRVRLVSPCPMLLASVDRFLPKPPSEFQPVHDQADVVFEFTGDSGIYGVAKNGRELDARTYEPAFLDNLENMFQLEVAKNAPAAVFVHAGVVALGRRVAIFPGVSYAGKSTLVHALVQRGATYLSDEYAVIDESGRVHPYLRPLSLRKGNDTAVRIYPADLPTPTHEEYRLVLILACHYRPRARWRAQPISRGEGILNLFANTVSARLTPERDIAYLTSATEESRFYRAERGDASRVADRILSLLAESPPL